MSTVLQLPERPNLEQLKKRAKEIAKESGVPLAEAQLQMARSYGFASWPKLRAHIDVVTDLTRLPDEAPESFLTLACLNYGNDAPARLARANEMLTADPSLASRDIWHAAACANAVGITGDVNAEGGPFKWAPLMYLTYSRIETSEADVLATARALLDAGADPNVGYLWHGLSCPFTALTGAFGQGEQGPENQPEHPHWRTLARLLLERGACANDGQTLYNRMFVAGCEHLELLREFGLGNDDFGPWPRRLGPQFESKEAMFERQMVWAVRHNMADRIELLEAIGVPNNVAAPTAPLIQAVAFSDYDRVRQLVADGHDVNKMGRGDFFSDEPWQTPLHTAVEHRDADMMRLLLELGADPSITDARFNATPAGWADHFGYDELQGLFR